MKIRNGFISNSSSSSFVVAFPRKPKTVSDVIEMAYNGNPDFEIGTDYNDKKVLATEAARDILNQIENGKKATLTQIAKEFQSRYYYDVYDNSYSLDRYFNLRSEYGWGTSIKERYFGTDKKSLDKLAENYLNEHKESEEYRKKLRVIEIQYFKIKNFPISFPGDVNDKKAFKAYWNKHDKHLNAARNTKEYKDIESLGSPYFKYEPERRKLILKVAQSDAKAFMEDNKGSYIAMFNYSDNDGEFGCVMEHGETFANLPHVTISHH